jgi:orotidine-5'-phosphate decarboxylase
LNVRTPKLVGVTVLTSDARTDKTDALILERARMAKSSGLDGVVASSEEAAMLRRECGKSFILVTPGIRPAGEDVGDQKRVTTPAQAIQNGSDYLVVGRPIVKASNPSAAAQAIAKDIAGAHAR